MRGVSQISPPIRILLVSAVAFLAAWMLFLRPSDNTSSVSTPKPPPTAPGQKGLTNAVDKAKGAAAAQESRDQKVQQATGGEQAGTAQAPSSTATKAATGQGNTANAAAAKAAAGDLPRPVLKAIADRKVLVLLFWNPKSADDRAVRRAVAKVDRWDGAVFVRTANIKSVSRYGRITRGADVEQSPTVVVVDRKLKAERLVGYVDTRTIDQSVVDAIRNSGTLIKAAYLRKINDVCLSAGNHIFAIPQPNGPGAQMQAAATGLQHRFARFSARFKAIPAPKKFRAFKRASVRDLNALAPVYAGFAAKVGNGKSVPAIVAAARTYLPREARISKRWNARMDKRHVLSCGSNF